jgi:hypothetical protein
MRDNNKEIDMLFDEILPLDDGGTKERITKAFPSSKHGFHDHPLSKKLRAKSNDPSIT